MSEPGFDHPGAWRHEDTLVSQWLAKAAGDLTTARRELLTTEAPNFDAVCYHAQQSAEKFLKAALQARGKVPPKVHDLVHLHALVQRVLPGWSVDVSHLSELSSAAVEARYPGFSTSREAAERSFEVAANLWAVLRPLV